MIQFRYFSPAAVIKGDCRPAGHFKAGIIGLAVVDIGKNQWPGGGFPAFIGVYHFTCAIGVGDLKLSDERQFFPVIAVLSPEPDVPAIPAVSQRSA